MRPTRIINNLLVTGGAGFIGSAFIRFLLKNSEFTGNIVNLDLLTYAGDLKNFESVADDPRHTFVEGDICNYPLVEKLCQEHDIDTIVHFAAESHVDRSIDMPKTFIETNVVGTFQLLEIVRHHPHIHLHHVSTDEVYGSLGKDGLFVETTAYQPSSPYSASKAAADHLVRAYGRTYGISFTLSNCSNNYGPYQHPEKLIPLMITRCLEGKTLPIYGDGSNIRDWLYVEDHADALWEILLYGRRSETYNIGGECERATIDIVHQLIQEIAEMKGESPDLYHERIRFVEDRPGHDFRYAIDCNKLKSELSWKPKHNFEDGLKDTISWYMQQESKKTVDAKQ
jgi:dTDP-glucose 4,6-dehydratase